MRIKLIYPDSSKTHTNHKKAIRKFFRAPPLNLLILAGLTPNDIEVEIIDERYKSINFDNPVDLVAITAITSTAPRAYQVGDEFKKRGVKVVLGGVHPSFLPDEAVQHANSVVIGEAELVWHQLLEDCRTGELKQFYRSKNYPCLDKLPFPRWDLLPNRNRYIHFIQTMRGCPNDCYFCSVTEFSGKKIRIRPVSQVIEEIKSLPKGFIIFVDDNIFAKLSYAKELFQALIPLKIKWGAEASLNFINKDSGILTLASKSGCRALFIGMESISQKALDSVNKGFNKVKEFGNTVRELHKHGIAVVSSLILGFDEDDPGIFKRTLKVLNEIKVDASIFSILTPLPGTKLYSKLKSAGRIFEHDWSKFDALHATFKPLKMMPYELEKGVEWLYRKFYSVPNTLRRIIRGWQRNPFIIPVNLGYFVGAMRKLLIGSN